MKASIASQLQRALTATRGYLQSSYDSLRKRLEEMEENEARPKSTEAKSDRTQKPTKKAAQTKHPQQQHRSSVTKKAKASAKPKSEREALPIKNYKNLTVQDIKRRLNRLDKQEIQQLKSYESHHKKRKTLLQAFDRQLH